MTSQPKTRLLPRFGLKSLFALVLVVAAGLGIWPWLKERAIRDVKTTATLRINTGRDMPAIIFDEHLEPATTTSAIAPYFLLAPESKIEYSTATNDGSVVVNITGWRHRYYVWLFGWTVRLPLTTELQ